MVEVVVSWHDTPIDFPVKRVKADNNNLSLFCVHSVLTEFFDDALTYCCLQ